MHEGIILAIIFEGQPLACEPESGVVDTGRWWAVHTVPPIVMLHTMDNAISPRRVAASVIFQSEYGQDIG